MSTRDLETATLTGLLHQLDHAPRPCAPELFCPFEPAIHPAVESLQARSLSWACEVGLAPGSAARRRLDAAKIAWLVARAYPRGETAMVQIAADWTTVFCLLDDRLERLPSPTAVARYLGELARALVPTCGAEDDTWDRAERGDETGGDPLVRACADLRGRLSVAAPPDWHVRFGACVDQLFHAFVREAEVRAQGEIPDLDTYVPMREVTVGIHVECAIGELAEGIELNELARGRKERVRLRRMASNIIGWANDIHTYEKELRQGEVTNLVMVLAAAHGLCLGDALALAVAKHDAEVRSFVALGAAITASDPDEGTRREVAMLGAWVRGHLDWAHETGRYNPGRAPEPAREGAAVHSRRRAAAV